MILGDALERVADEAHPARLQVVEPPEIVEHLAARRIGGQSVDGEVAPRRVLAPILGVGDGGAAAVGGDVAAQGGDLDRLAADHGGDRAVGEAGRHRLDPRRLEPADHLVGRDPGGEVDVARLEAEQGVAHAAADESRLARRRAKRREQPVHARPVLPGGVGQAHATSAEWGQSLFRTPVPSLSPRRGKGTVPVAAAAARKRVTVTIFMTPAPAGGSGSRSSPPSPPRFSGPPT